MATVTAHRHEKQSFQRKYVVGSASVEEQLLIMTALIRNRATLEDSDECPSLKEQEDLRKLKLAELRREIHKGIDSLERGEGTPFDVEEIKAEGRRRFA